MLKVYVKGFVGNLGTIVLIEKKYDELVKIFNDEFLKYVLENINVKDGSSPSLSMLDKIEVDKEEINKGGFLSALWKICDRNKWGLKYSLRKVPIMQGTIEISNYFDINPYRLLTEKSYIYIIEDEKIDISKYDDLYLIGEITNEKKRVRIDGEVDSFLTKDFKDEIDKILPKYIKNYYEEK